MGFTFQTWQRPGDLVHQCLCMQIHCHSYKNYKVNLFKDCLMENNWESFTSMKLEVVDE